MMHTDQRQAGLNYAQKRAAPTRPINPATPNAPREAVLGAALWEVWAGAEPLEVAEEELEWLEEPVDPAAPEVDAAGLEPPGVVEAPGAVVPAGAEALTVGPAEPVAPSVTEVLMQLESELLLTVSISE